MRRISIIIISLLLSVFLFSIASAIERTPRKDSLTSGEKKEVLKTNPPAKVEKEEIQSEEAVNKETETRKPEKEKGIFKIFKKQKPDLKKEITEKKYDYFIDKNGNGIDDRLEKKKEEKSTEQKSEKKTISPAGKGRRR